MRNSCHLGLGTEWYGTAALCTLCEPSQHPEQSMGASMHTNTKMRAYSRSDCMHARVDTANLSRLCTKSALFMARLPVGALTLFQTFCVSNYRNFFEKMVLDQAGFPSWWGFGLLTHARLTQKGACDRPHSVMP